MTTTSTASDPSNNMNNGNAEPRPTPGPKPDPSTFVRVRTTLPRIPLPPNSARQPVTTPRLVIRPLSADDLHALHELRAQPEVMQWTALGKTDRNLEDTWAKLAPFLPPKDEGTYNHAICDRETGQLIGLGGCHVFKSGFGWPEIGYMIRKEYWGKGLATEFLGGWLRLWEGLEREEVELEVDARTVAGQEVVGRGDGDVVRVREQVVALTVKGNGKSQKVLAKSEFEWFLTWQEEDTRDGVDGLVELPSYRYFPGKKKGQ